MKSPYRIVGAALCLLAFGSVLLAGCKSGGGVSPEEEKAFRNPPKDMPPEAVKYMKEHSGPNGAAKAPK
jgi:hypothetical protein